MLVNIYELLPVFFHGWQKLRPFQFFHLQLFIAIEISASLPVGVFNTLQWFPRSVYK